MTRRSRSEARSASEGAPRDLTCASESVSASFIFSPWFILRHQTQASVQLLVPSFSHQVCPIVRLWIQLHPGPQVLVQVLVFRSLSSVSAVRTRKHEPGSPGLTLQISILLLVLMCGLLQELIPVILLSCRIENLEVSRFKLHSRGDFPNTPTRCSVKCL
jgi:hypothetical protein